MHISWKVPDEIIVKVKVKELVNWMVKVKVKISVTCEVKFKGFIQAKFKVKIHTKLKISKKPHGQKSLPYSTPAPYLTFRKSPQR